MTQTLLSRLSCYLSGHDYTIRQAAGRMFLVCTACGHRSEGVPLITQRPTASQMRPAQSDTRRTSSSAANRA